MSAIIGIYSKQALLAVHHMLGAVPHMQSHSNAAAFSEAIELLGRLGSAPGDEATVQLSEE